LTAATSLRRPPDGGYHVSHEYLGDASLPPGLGLHIPSKLVPLETIRKHLPQVRHYAIDDSQSSTIPLWVRTTLQLIGTRAVLVAPFVLRERLLGVHGPSLLPAAASLDGVGGADGRVAGRPGIDSACSSPRSIRTRSKRSR
jgi:hypothetical protein